MTNQNNKKQWEQEHNYELGSGALKSNQDNQYQVSSVGVITTLELT